MASTDNQRNWVSTSLTFIRRSVVEPVVFLSMFGFAFRGIAFTQLQQDKICLQTFNQSRAYCKFLSTEEDSDLKDNIVASLATYSTYKEFLVIIPSIITALYIGSWCDKFVKGIRYCLLSTSFAQLFETILFLINALYMDAHPLWTVASVLPPSLFGNDFGTYTAIYAYVAVFAKDHEKGTRYILVPLSWTLAWTIGNYLAGVVIAMKPMFNDQQLHNYAGNFAVSCCISLVLILWCLVVLKDVPKEPREQTSVEHLETSGTTAESTTASTSLDSNNNNNNNNEGRKEQSLRHCRLSETKNEKRPILIKDVESSSESTGFCQALKQLFDLKHIADIWQTCVKKRPGTVRLRMWLMIIVINLALLPAFGRNAVIFPLVQKLYKWDSVIYSNLNSYSGIIHIFAMIFGIPLLFKVVKANDCETAVIGILMGIIGDVFIGSIVSPWGFYVHAIITSFGVGGATGCRAYISKALPKDEVAKVFAITLLIEAAFKAIASFLFAFLLQLTIHAYPTFVFHFMGVILIAALVITVWADLITPYPLVSTP